jgi:hypothetical protein
MACCIAWLNISVVMRLPPDEGPAAKDVPEPVERLEAGNNPDDSNSLYLSNGYLQYFMGILFLSMYRSHRGMSFILCREHILFHFNM